MREFQKENSLICELMIVSVFWDITYSVLVDSYQNLEKPDASSFRLGM